GAGQFIVSGANATLAGSINITGSNTFSGGSANLIGNYICTNNTMTITAGTVNFNGTGVVFPLLVNFSNGTLGGSNLVTVGSLMNWTAGTMTGSGRTVISPAATLNLPGSISLVGRTLENGGTVVRTGNGSLGMDAGSVITNRAGALFDVQS